MCFEQYTLTFFKANSVVISNQIKRSVLPSETTYRNFHWRANFMRFLITRHDKNYSTQQKSCTIQKSAISRCNVKIKIIMKLFRPEAP